MSTEDCYRRAITEAIRIYEQLRLGGGGTSEEAQLVINPFITDWRQYLTEADEVEGKQPTTAGTILAEGD